MRIAFYAPMKAPAHAVPSGDRQIARLLWRALESKDHNLDLASNLRAWNGVGDCPRQQEIKNSAIAESDRYLQILREEDRPNIWFTYHAYHKAPDWIGPRVSQALEIPYVIAEASYAAKQAHGPWAEGLEQTQQCLNLAQAIINLNSNDIDGIKQVVSDHRRLHYLKPFIDVEKIQSHLKSQTSKHEIATRLDLNTDALWLVTVAMMRPGDKLASFKILADALRQVKRNDFQLIIVGDGKARGEVERAFSDVLHTSVRFVGQLLHRKLLPLLNACDLFVWPAINEAYGMAMLEAQACGVPVVAGDYGGVASIVDNGRTGLLTVPGNTPKFAQAIVDLIDNPTKLKTMASAAHQNVNVHHSLERAAGQLDHILSQLQ